MAWNEEVHHQKDYRENYLTLHGHLSWTPEIRNLGRRHLQRMQWRGGEYRTFAVLLSSAGKQTPNATGTGDPRRSRGSRGSRYGEHKEVRNRLEMPKHWTMRGKRDITTLR